jgi:hypothetical protein
LCLLTGQFADAAAIGQHWQGVAVELANVSEEYESVAKPVDFLIKVGPFGALIAAGMPFVLQILANHKIVPAASLAGQCIMPPEVLEAQMRAQILRMQADAVRAQNDALQEARDAQAAYDAMTMDGVSDAELVGAAG